MSSPITRYFEFAHLSTGPARQVSSILCNHARYMDAVLPDGAEKSAGLRKLLEAKDCLVRAALDLPDDFELPAVTQLD